MRAQDILPDDQNQLAINGVPVRKGSVGAFLASARVWGNPDASAAQRAEAERDIVEVLPALRALGLFDALAIRDEALRQFVESH